MTKLTTSFLSFLKSAFAIGAFFFAIIIGSYTHQAYAKPDLAKLRGAAVGAMEACKSCHAKRQVDEKTKDCCKDGINRHKMLIGAIDSGTIDKSKLQTARDGAVHCAKRGCALNAMDKDTCGAENEKLIATIDEFAFSRTLG